MKIKRPNKFRQGNDPARIERYLAVDLQNTLTDVTTALTRLTFRDNFKSQTAIVTLSPGVDTEVKHSLGVVPSGRLIIRSNSNAIVDGDAAWTKDAIYLKNIGATVAVITVILLG